MQLIEWFDKNERKLQSQMEKDFVSEVFWKEFGEEGLDNLDAQVRIYDEDFGENHDIDFVFKTKNNLWAIETDGLYFHAESNTSKERYDKLQRKENTIDSHGYRTIHFTSSKLQGSEKNPDLVRYELRRRLISDEDARRFWYNQREGLVPHEIQQETLESIANDRSDDKNKGMVLYPTGLGKTYLAGFDVKNFDPKKLLFIVHQKELLFQSRTKFEDILFERVDECGNFFGNDSQYDKNILFSSIQKLAIDKNLKRFKKDQFDYIIIDESHHSAAATYEKVINYFEPKFFLGLTATPKRMDKKDVLKYYDNHIFYQITREEAQLKGFLVNSVYWGLWDDIDYSKIEFNGKKYNVNDLNKALIIEKRDEAVLKEFKNRAFTKKTLGFCASIEHANHMSKLFNDEGINAVSIHSGPGANPSESIQDFRDNKSQVAFVVDMFNEGMSVNDVECLMFLRPTESDTIFTQQYGRGLRVSNNKEDVIVLDFIGNYRTADTVNGYFGFKGGHKDFKQREDDEKYLFWFDNFGNEVNFDEKVLKHIERLEEEKLKEPRQDRITSEWNDYSAFLSSATEENLYIKIGKQNKKIQELLKVLEVLELNPQINDEELSKEANKFSSTMQAKSGVNRHLFFPKLLGLVSSKKPFVLKESYFQIKDRCSGEFEQYAKYEDIISRQYEKVFYWNEICGKVNKYKAEENIVNFNVIGSYPVLLINLVIKTLIEEYEFTPDESFISKDELNFFLLYGRNTSDYKEVAEKIYLYRNEKSKKDVELLLKNSTKNLDSRLLNAFKNSPIHYIDIKKDKIYLKEDHKSIKFEELEYIEKLIFNNNLISYEKDSELYYKMLYSTDSVVDFHKNYLASS